MKLSHYTYTDHVCITITITSLSSISRHSSLHFFASPLLSATRLNLLSSDVKNATWEIIPQPVEIFYLAVAISSIGNNYMHLQYPSSHSILVFSPMANFSLSLIYALAAVINVPFHKPSEYPVALIATRLPTTTTNLSNLFKLYEMHQY